MSALEMVYDDAQYKLTFTLLYFTMVCHFGLVLATVNLTTKFEVSIFTQYEDMKGDTKCRNWVVWGT